MRKANALTGTQMFLRFNVRLNPRKGVLVSEGRGRSTELTLFPRFKITINTIHPLFLDRVCRGRKMGRGKASCNTSGGTRVGATQGKQDSH